MNNLLGQFEWHGPQVPTQQEIIKTLHQELMVKELRIKELVEVRLVEADAEIERIQHNLKVVVTANVDLSKQLAASQLREKVLREALEMVDRVDDETEMLSGPLLKCVCKALKVPTNDSALREFVCSVFEKAYESGSILCYMTKFKNGEE